MRTVKLALLPVKPVPMINPLPQDFDRGLGTILLLGWHVEIIYKYHHLFANGGSINASFTSENKWSVPISLWVIPSLMYWNVEGFGPFWMWQRNRDSSFTSMKNITIFWSQLQLKMHNFPNSKFKSRACQNTLKSSKRNWNFQVTSSGNVRLKNKCLVRSITTNGYLSSFDRIMSWVWFDVVWAEKFMKLAIYLK